MSAGRVIPSDAARAVGRFNPNGPDGYRCSLGGPIRATRAEAVADYVELVEHVDDKTTCGHGTWLEWCRKPHGEILGSLA